MSKRMFMLAVALVGFSAWSAQADDKTQTGGFSACLDLFPGASVPTPKSTTITDLCKTADGAPIFAVRFDTTRKTPNWTAHSLSPAQMAAIKANSGTMKRPKFKPDPDLPGNEQAVDKSYTNSGFSRGHIVPANDMSWSKASYDTTFYLSNVVPQKQTFNAGTWLGAEDAFRNYVVDKNVTMWNFSGVYATVESEPSIGTAPNTPTVPQCYYKLIAAPQGDGKPYKVLALIYHWDDFAKQRTWPNAVTTVAQVETRTGIDFFNGLDVEESYDAAYWGLAMPDTPGDCQ